MTANRRSLCLPAAFLLALAGCAGPGQAPSTEVRAVWRDRLPTAVDDPGWRGAPYYPAQLLPQDLVDPRLMDPSTPRARIEAATDGERIAFRISWPDSTRDDVPGAARFSDACAVQLPRTTEADVPAPQMGEAGRRVEITYWRASWQAWSEGRKDDIRSLYPGASIDHYPFEAASLEPGSDEQRAMARRYSPARALGNAMEGPRERPVEDLVAEGPGTLSRAPEQRSEGAGKRGGDGWEVVLVRPAPHGLAAGGRSEVAFAIWDGARQEAGSRKMRTGWIPLALEARP